MSRHYLDPRKNDLLRRMRRYLDDAPKAFSRAGRNLQKYAKEQPLATALAAFTGSFLVAHLISRR